MKIFLIYIIKTYQVLLSPDKGFFVQIGFKKPTTCMFYPTCSDFTIKEVSEKGIFRGLCSGFGQILKCHPYGKKNK